MLSLVAWIIPIFFTLIVSFLLITDKKNTFKLRIKELREILGKPLFDILLISHFLLWVVPFNGLLILFSLILPSQVINKKQRESWSSNYKSRTIFL